MCLVEINSYEVNGHLFEINLNVYELECIHTYKWCRNA